MDSKRRRYLMDEVADDGEVYLNKAVLKINEVFGVGFAQEHPELVAAFIQACAMQDIYHALNGIKENFGGSFYEMIGVAETIADALKVTADAQRSSRKAATEKVGVNGVWK